MSLSLKSHYDAMVIPACKTCNGNGKFVIRGFPSQELLTYALSSDSRVILGDCCNREEGSFYCPTCKVYY